MIETYLFKFITDELLCRSTRSKIRQTIQLRPQHITSLLRIILFQVLSSDCRCILCKNICRLIGANVAEYDEIIICSSTMLFGTLFMYCKCPTGLAHTTVCGREKRQLETSKL